MALTKNKVTVQGIELTNGYFRVDEVSGNKTNVNIRLRVYASQAKCTEGALWLEEIIYDFTPSIEAGSENFIKQSYEYLKTLPEFEGAVDC